MKSKCTDPEAGAKIPLEIAFPLATGREPELSTASKRHLEICASCRQSLPLWYEKGRRARKSTESFDIVNSAEKGDPSILRKETASGVALFKPDPNNAGVGTFVLITPNHIIQDPERKTLDEFKGFD